MNVMLSVDLNGATSSERREFDEAMAKQKWKKWDNVSTTYTASFQSNVSYEGALSVTKRRVMESAKEAGISNWTALVQVGDNLAEAF